MAKDRWDQVTGYCCGTCRYFSPKEGDVGRCRRRAPTMAGYPVVYAGDDWCGDHKVGTNPHKQAAGSEASDAAMEHVAQALGGDETK